MGGSSKHALQARAIEPALGSQSTWTSDALNLRQRAPAYEQANFYDRCVAR